MSELVVENLGIRLGGNEILKGVSLNLERGQVAALLGASGSGKTTLLRSVAGLETPSFGRIAIGGKPVFDGAEGLNKGTEERGLGFVFQSYALWPHRTVEQNVAYSLKLRRLPRAQIAQRVQKTLDSLGLGKLGHRYPHELSGGQQQRVALARALVYEPTVVLLDEPLSNLDAKLREEARAFLKELIERENLAALLVTHDQAEALAIASKILLLNNGVVEQSGTPQEIYEKPATLYAAEFMGSNNRLDGKIGAIENGTATLVTSAGAVTGLRRSSTVTAGALSAAIIRVEAVRVETSEGRNRLCLDLATSMFLGSHWEHVFRKDDITLRAHTQTSLPPGQYWLELSVPSLWIY